MKEPNPTQPAHPGRRPAGPMPPPAVPLTLDGSALLHQMFRVRWTTWKALDGARRKEIIDEAVALLAEMEQHEEGGSALFSELGHKGDLILVHFRRSFDAVNQAEMSLSQLALADYLEATSSYVSVVELGLYESSVQLYESLLEQGVEPRQRRLAQSRARQDGRVASSHGRSSVADCPAEPLPVFLPHG